MADPAKMTLMAASTALQVGGALQQGAHAKNVGEYNKRAAYNEAESLDIQAGQEVAAGTHQVSRIAKRAAEIMAQQRANAAAGGGSTQDASVVAIQKETVGNATLDQLMTIVSAQERAQQIRHGAEVRRREGDFALMQGKQAKKASYMKAATTLLDAGASWQSKFGGGAGEGAGAASSPATTSFSGIGPI